MNIGCAREVMRNESRVALIPDGASGLIIRGAKVFMQKSAGKHSGFPDSAYRISDATLATQDQVWEQADIILKVKQPLENEFELLRENSILFCFLHLADNLPLLDVLIKKNITAIGYETIQLENGSTPILAAMSKIAGRMAFFDGAKLLIKHRGMMIGPESTVTIIGLGNAGTAAAELVVRTNPKMLYLFDKNPEKFEMLRHFLQSCSPYDLWFVWHDRENASHQRQLATILQKTDLLIASAHIPGEKQAKIVTERMIKNMPRGSVAIDISIDQGGALETSAHHEKPSKQVFLKHGVWHYCVPNMPGRVPREATPALTRETFPYIAELSEKGFERAVRENPALAHGVNTHKGWITHEGVARSIDKMKDYKPLDKLL
jgi:alanine dehydrogenase